MKTTTCIVCGKDTINPSCAECEAMTAGMFEKMALLNRLLDATKVLALNPNGFGDAREEYELVKSQWASDRAEVLDLMNR